jgi:hypothetical protein
MLHACGTTYPRGICDDSGERSWESLARRHGCVDVGIGRQGRHGGDVWYHNPRASGV